VAWWWEGGLPYCSQFGSPWAQPWYEATSKISSSHCNRTTSSEVPTSTPSWIQGWIAPKRSCWVWLVSRGKMEATQDIDWALMPINW
jgi:hypothetical protein